MGRIDAARFHFEYLLTSGALDDDKDGEHVKAIESGVQAMNLLRQMQTVSVGGLFFICPCCGSTAYWRQDVSHTRDCELMNLLDKDDVKE